jgi:putative ABC transport system permease protein
MFFDLKYAIRSLFRSPGFTAVSVLILALGIGAITAVFSAVETVLLHPLPYSRPAELYCVHSATVNQVGLFSIPEYCTYRDQNRSFDGLAAVGSFSTNLMDHGEAQFIQGQRVSANLFDLLGARPAAGRLLVADDDRPGAARVAVISEGLWQRSFGGRADVVGRTVSIDGRSYDIVGVLPPGFILPIIGFHNDVCVPLQADADPMRYVHGSLNFLRVIGRVRPGMSQAQVLADMSGILKDLRLRYPKEYGGSGDNQLIPLTTQIVGDSRPMLLTLFGLVLALLLLAATNLAGLHVVRAIGRHHDFALRTALGASRGRLMRLVIAECLVLSVVGGLGGLVLADWGLKSLLSFVPADLPRGHDLGFNGSIFAFAAAVSLGFGLAPALAPVWLVSRVDLRGAIASGGPRTAGGQRRFRNFLASTQVALALALLACTALFLRSFWAVGAQRLGFEATHALTVRLTLPEAGYKDTDSLFRHYERLQARLVSIPGVTNVGATSLLPLVPGLANAQFKVPGRPPVPDADLPSANYRLVTPGFFAAMRIPLVQGRTFTEHDDREHPLALVISASMARAVFPHDDAIGQRLDIQDTATGYRTAQIVGVVGDVKEGKIEDAPAFEMYVPYRQMDPVAVLWLRYRTFWIFRGSLPPAAMESALRREIHAEDASIAISSVRTLEQVTDSALSARKFTLLIVGFFAATALILTIAGIYSVIAFGVAQRTREIGVRLALGAKAEQIFGLIIGEGLAIVGFGAPVGILASLLLSQLIAAQLYGVSPRDPWALAAAILMIAIVAFLACWLPARRASRVDPIVALRTE